MECFLMERFVKRIERREGMSSRKGLRWTMRLTRSD
jgi:hypothetical protein